MALVVGALTGLAYAMSPGPVNAETVRQGSCGGLRAALAVQAGAVAADLIYGLLAFLGLATVFARPLPHTLLGVAGTLLLLVLGASSLRKGWRKTEGSLSMAGRESDCARSAAPRTFVAGLGISFINPYSVFFWLSLDSTLLPTDQPGSGLALATFFLAVAGWGAILAFGASCCRLLRSSWVPRLTSILCGLMLLASGLSLGHALATTGPF